MSPDDPPAARDPRVAAGGTTQAYFSAAWAIEAPWDTGAPQPAIVAAADHLVGRVLDVGCGSGEHALFAASRGCQAVGVDFVPAAIEAARAKAAARAPGAGGVATFEVADVFDVLGPYDTIVDVGLFHAFSDDDRVRYRDWLARTLTPGGTLLLLCFSDEQPGDGPPRRLTEHELRDLFVEPFGITDLRRDRYQTRLPDGTLWEGAAAWRLTAMRTQ